MSDTGIFEEMQKEEKHAMRFVFPIKFDRHEEVKNMWCGLQKRELFAGMAMQSIISNNEFTGDADKVAKIAVEYADALITELNKTKKG